ncbi:3-phosphoshikimate 1-carboxyvinyltransferase [Vibrio parahaemolyticus]|uniref:3-phosphoshikimate 1-carboxyvinyltransferase n=1 Tax=Vibrio parahaemolyticus TaxID=670 RepID=UPI001EFD79FF|nr:3-phosphoshikimate 1-carboxyvinyltransferase [Vibrio parahaemolyticus]MCG9635030.1 3-phosphoshikimate 1-carboxyvinyltransferase [Vibrio parahaemolyticus]
MNEDIKDTILYNYKGHERNIVELEIPGDKSISHRAVIFSSLSKSTVVIKNLLKSDDVICTINAFKAMGVKIDEIDENDEKIVVVHGVGLRGLKKPDSPLYMGNSGTACRLILGILSAQNFVSEVTGDESLSQRPMNRIIEPLKKMGACIHSNEGKLPIIVKPVEYLKSIDYQMPVVSAQVKSSILLAGLYANGQTVVSETCKTRTYTEDMISQYIGGISILENTIILDAAKEYHIDEIVVPSDISSAAFFIVATIIKKSKSTLLIKGVDYSKQRNGLIRNLIKMGAYIEVNLLNERSNIADLKVTNSKLKGIKLDPIDVGDMIDEFPIFMVAALAADGTTVVSGAEELRVKESDRIASMVQGFNNLGIDIEEKFDGFTIKGTISGENFKGGQVSSYHDHRVAMTFAISSILFNGSVVVQGSNTIKTSFPNFNDLATSIGITSQ